MDILITYLLLVLSPSLFITLIIQTIRKKYDQGLVIITCLLGLCLFLAALFQFIRIADLENQLKSQPVAITVCKTEGDDPSCIDEYQLTGTVTNNYLLLNDASVVTSSDEPQLCGEIWDNSNQWKATGGGGLANFRPCLPLTP